jgi:hypothetical protein
MTGKLLSLVLRSVIEEYKNPARTSRLTWRSSRQRTRLATHQQVREKDHGGGGGRRSPRVSLGSIGRSRRARCARNHPRTVLQSGRVLPPLPEFTPARSQPESPRKNCLKGAEEATGDRNHVINYLPVRPMAEVGREQEIDVIGRTAGADQTTTIARRESFSASNPSSPWRETTMVEQGEMGAGGKRNCPQERRPHGRRRSGERKRIPSQGRRLRWARSSRG